jgi:hypothetical protein
VRNVQKRVLAMMELSMVDAEHCAASSLLRVGRVLSLCGALHVLFWDIYPPPSAVVVA